MTPLVSASFLPAESTAIAAPGSFDSRPLAQDRPFATAMTPDTVPFNQQSWDRWLANGRKADAAFRDKLRTIALIATVAAGLGVLWIIIG